MLTPSMQRRATDHVNSVAKSSGFKKRYTCLDLELFELVKTQGSTAIGVSDYRTARLSPGTARVELIQTG
jgi:hypothetical protein